MKAETRSKNRGRVLLVSTDQKTPGPHNAHNPKHQRETTDNRTRQPRMYAVSTKTPTTSRKTQDSANQPRDSVAAAPPSPPPLAYRRTPVHRPGKRRDGAVHEDPPHQARETQEIRDDERVQGVVEEGRGEGPHGVDEPPLGAERLRDPRDAPSVVLLPEGERYRLKKILGANSGRHNHERTRAICSR